MAWSLLAMPIRGEPWWLSTPTPARSFSNFTKRSNLLMAPRQPPAVSKAGLPSPEDGSIGARAQKQVPCSQTNLSNSGTAGTVSSRSDSPVAITMTIVRTLMKTRDPAVQVPGDNLVLLNKDALNRGAGSCRNLPAPRPDPSLPVAYGTR